MKINSTRPPRRDKPAKPYPDFPLFAHATGRWAKKIRGKMMYFGPWDDWQAALERYGKEKDFLHAGLPVPDSLAEAGELTVRELLNEYERGKRALKDNGELSRRHYDDIVRSGRIIIEHFGPDRAVATIKPTDFTAFREALAKGRGLIALGNEIQRCRSIFRFASEQDLIEHPLKFGAGFSKPSAKLLRKARAERPSKMLEAKQIKRLIDKAGQPVKAMILLGINCGFGNSDVGNLPLDALDLRGSWVTFPRPKTQTARRAKLWPETVKALREAIKQRPAAKSNNPDPVAAADEIMKRERLVFITKPGASWAKNTADNPVSKEFTKLLKELKYHKAGLGFYSLRHVFRTVADEVGDRPAVDLVMGHTPTVNDMSAVYRERIGDGRLARVAEHVHKWLFGKKKPRDASDSAVTKKKGARKKPAMTKAAR